jgi:hypothetical protein
VVSEAEQAALKRRAAEIGAEYRKVIEETIEKANRARLAKVPTATVTKTAGKPTATERVHAQAVLEHGDDVHEIDKAVLTLLAAGRESEVMNKAAEAERWGILDRPALQASGNLWRTRMPATVTAMRELLAATPANRAGRVEKAREQAFREATPDAVRFRIGEVGRLRELVEMADQWGAQGAPATDPAVLVKAQADALVAQVTRKVEAALAPVEARLAEVNQMLAGRATPKGQR